GGVGGGGGVWWGGWGAVWGAAGGCGGGGVGGAASGGGGRWGRGVVRGPGRAISGAVALGGGGGVIVRSRGVAASPRGCFGHESAPYAAGRRGRGGLPVGDVDRVERCQRAAARAAGVTFFDRPLWGR